LKILLSPKEKRIKDIKQFFLQGKQSKKWFPKVGNQGNVPYISKQGRAQLGSSRGNHNLLQRSQSLLKSHPIKREKWGLVKEKLRILPLLRVKPNNL